MTLLFPLLRIQTIYLIFMDFIKTSFKSKQSFKVLKWWVFFNTNYLFWIVTQYKLVLFVLERKYKQWNKADKSYVQDICSITFNIIFQTLSIFWKLSHNFRISSKHTLLISKTHKTYINYGEQWIIYLNYVCNVWNMSSCHSNSI